jgi:hypothetical protein
MMVGNLGAVAESEITEEDEEAEEVAAVPAAAVDDGATQIEDPGDEEEEVTAGAPAVAVEAAPGSASTDIVSLLDSNPKGSLTAPHIREMIGYA